MHLTDSTGQAVGYILEHVGESLTVDQVADHCHFSKFYFSRRFKAETGESPYAFIRRARLETSAFRLKTEPDRSVTDIGWDYGYSSSNYSTVFRQRFGARPVEFRKTTSPRPSTRARRTKRPPSGTPSGTPSATMRTPGWRPWRSLEARCSAGRCRL